MTDRQDKIDRIMTIYRWHREDMEAYQLLDELLNVYSMELDAWSDKDIDSEYDNLESDMEMYGMENI